MQVVLGPVELIVVIYWQVVVELIDIDGETGFVCPAARNVLDRVATTTKDK